MDNQKIDRRIIRSKTLLKNALRELLTEKKFKYVTVQEISERSTVNRATFYKHYIDKHSLLEGVFQEDFQRLLEERTEKMNSVDKKLLRQIIHAVADFLLPIGQRRLDEHHIFIPLEQKTVQQMIVDRLLNAMETGSKKENILKVRVKAAMTGWAIYAAVSQWIELSLQKKLDKNDTSLDGFAEKILDPITGLIK